MSQSKSDKSVPPDYKNCDAPETQERKPCPVCGGPRVGVSGANGAFYSAPICDGWRSAYHGPMNHTLTVTNKYGEEITMRGVDMCADCAVIWSHAKWETPQRIIDWAEAKFGVLPDFYADEPERTTPECLYEDEEGETT